MVATSKKTTANGNVVKYDADDHGATLRRVAAALPRAAGVDRITSSPTADATVWFDGRAEADAFFVGSYVDVVDVFVPSSGHGKVGVNVDL